MIVIVKKTLNLSALPLKLPLREECLHDLFVSLCIRSSSGQQRSHCGGPALICQRAGGPDRPHGKNTLVPLCLIYKHPQCFLSSQAHKLIYLFIYNAMGALCWIWWSLVSQLGFVVQKITSLPVWENSLTALPCLQAVSETQHIHSPLNGESCRILQKDGVHFKGRVNKIGTYIKFHVKKYLVLHAYSH